MTIVVPVYGALPLLLQCIQSLKDTVDLAVDRVLLVNDCGPDADDIERELLGIVGSTAGFSYHRNEQNLGFVGTCNRAAFDLDTTDNDLLFLNSDTVCTAGFLDELSAVLHLSERHGAVCPRSNNATIASLPYALRDPAAGRSRERTSEVYEQLRDQLPRFAISPVAMGFCILIRRHLVRRFGLFDEIFAPGYGEENDFCLRIAAAGFASVISNHALVFHVAGQSFSGTARTRIRTAHEAILVSRYPQYQTQVRDYLFLQRDPVDVFADALAPGAGEPSVLIDLDWGPRRRGNPGYEALLSAANSHGVHLSNAITVAVPDRSVRGVSRRYRRLRVVSHGRLEGIWDISLASTTRPSASQLARLNRCALRWVLDPSIDGDAHHRIDAIAAASRSVAETVVEGLVGDWSRIPVNIALLRARWNTLTAQSSSVDGGTFPVQRVRSRIVRRIAMRLPSRALALVSRRRGRARF